MNESAENYLPQIHRLATAQLEGALTAGDQAELVTLLESSAEARQTYLQYVSDTVSLRWIYSGQCQYRLLLPVSDDAYCGTKAPLNRGRGAKWVALAMAAAVAGIMFGGSYLLRDDARGPRSNPSLAITNPSSPRTDDGTGGSGSSAEVAANAPTNPAAVATVTQASAVAWNNQASRRRLLSRVAVGDQLHFSTGTIELTFDTGAQVKVFGPAAIEISSSMSILCSRGRVTTLVGESGKGFTIDTPKARIVDLGTQFGVNISEEGDTEVVVFQGSVDLTSNAKQAPGEPASASGPDGGEPASAGGSWSRRLQQGDALVVGDEGKAKRVVAVQRSDFFPSSMSNIFGADRQAPLIQDVRDNIRAGESAKCYQIVRGGLREDAPCFVDRAHQWNGLDGSGLPKFLHGADYIMPFNDDKFISDLRVELQIARPADCYVFLDDNMPAPEWLKKGFVDTGLHIGLDGAKTVWHPNNKLGAGPGDSVDFVFSIWRRELAQPGTVVLGGVKPPEERRSRGFNMYGIAVVPK